MVDRRQEGASGLPLALVLPQPTQAEGSDRRHISELQLAPLVNFALPDLWFVNLYPSGDIRYNFGTKRPGDTGQWFVPFNFMVGKMLNRTTVTFVQFHIAIVNDYRVYDFKMEARFAIGDRDALKFNSDGSLDLLLRHESPGKDRESNWLPAPKGPFNLTMCVYAPRPVASTARQR
jgi:Protein of unknown function (DUF1214)